MKKSLPHIVLISILFVCISCQPENVETEVVEATFRITTGQAFQYNLGGYPTEGGLSIITQAKNFRVSEIRFDHQNGSEIIYEYISTDNFIGKDFVELQRADSAGGREIMRKTIYKFTFVIEE